MAEPAGGANAEPAGAVWRRYMELPRYLRVVEGGDGMVGELKHVAAQLGLERLCLVTGPTASAPIGAAIAAGLGQAAGTPLAVEDWNRTAVSALAADPTFAEAEVAVAIGGGKVLDVVKRACEQTGRPVVTVPTLLSADGIASPVAVIRADDGSVESLPARLPIAVVADLDAIASAPPETARAGLGDLLSNFSALRDWRRAEAAGVAEVDDFAALLARAGAELVTAGGLERFNTKEPGPDLLRRLLEGLVLSGLAMEIAGSSRPCSGAEHLISHAFDRQRPGTAPHGEQVAFGSLVATRLQGEDWRGLRTRLQDAGLDQAVRGFGLDAGEVVEVVRAASATRPDRYTVLDEVDLSPAALEPLVAEVLGG